MEMNIDTLNELIAQLPNGFNGCNNHVLVNTDPETNKPTVDGIVIAMPTEEPQVNVIYKLLINTDIVEVFSSPSTVDLSVINTLDLQNINEIYSSIYKNILVIKNELIYVCVQHFVNAHNEQFQAGTNALNRLAELIRMAKQPTEATTEAVETEIEVVETEAIKTETTKTKKPVKKQSKTTKKKTTKKQG